MQIDTAPQLAPAQPEQRKRGMKRAYEPDAAAPAQAQQPLSAPIQSPAPQASPAKRQSTEAARRFPRFNYSGMDKVPSHAPQPYKNVLQPLGEHRSHLDEGARKAFDRDYGRSGSLTAPAMTKSLAASLQARPTKTAQDVAVLAAIDKGNKVSRTDLEYDARYKDVPQGVHVAHKLSDNVIAGLVYQMGHQKTPLTKDQHAALHAHAMSLTGDKAQATQYVQNIARARELYAHPQFANSPMENHHRALLGSAVHIASPGVQNLRHGDATLNMAISRGADWNRYSDGRATPLSEGIEKHVHGLAAAGLISADHAKTAVAPRMTLTGQPVSSSEVQHTGPSAPLQMSRELGKAQAAALLKPKAVRPQAAKPQAAAAHAAAPLRARL
ncbi:MAG: hypothetical protein ACJ768_19120 [Gaiellaceae bacterium]